MKISWTQFLSFDTCTLQHHLRYIKKLRLPRDQSVFFTGALVHDAIKAWSETTPEPWQPDFLRPQAVELFKQRIGKVTTDPVKVKDLFHRVLTGLLSAQKVYYALNLPQHKAQVEYRFEAPIKGGHVLIGGFDAYDAVDQSLVDMKLYSTEGSEADHRQLLTYAVGLRAEKRPLKTASFVYPLRKSTVVTRTILEDEVVQHESVMAAMADQVVSQAYTPEARPSSEACHWCEFYRRPECPATYRSIGTEPRSSRGAYVVPMQTLGASANKESPHAGS